MRPKSSQAVPNISHSKSFQSFMGGILAFELFHLMKLNLKVGAMVGRWSQTASTRSLHKIPIDEYRKLYTVPNFTICITVMPNSFQ